jgi:hypothetical protein
MASHVARQRLGVEAGAAAGGGADQHGHLLAAIEVGDRILRGARRRRETKRRCGEDCELQRPLHDISSLAATLVINSTNP